MLYKSIANGGNTAFHRDFLLYLVWGMRGVVGAVEVVFNTAVDTVLSSADDYLKPSGSSDVAPHLFPGNIHFDCSVSGVSVSLLKAEVMKAMASYSAPAFARLLDLRGKSFSAARQHVSSFSELGGISDHGLMAFIHLNMPSSVEVP